MPLKYPFGPVPAVEARVSLQYDEHWMRKVVITRQHGDLDSAIISSRIYAVFL
jgi:hypothetical protein